MKKIFVLIMGMLFICFTLQADKTTAVGVVKSLQGSAQVERNKVKINVINGMSLYSDDIITTSANSVLKFSFSNNSIVTVKEGASLKISTLLEEEGKKSFLSLAFGRIAVSVKAALGKKDSYQIQNMSATVAIRGTVFSVSASEGTDLLVQVTKGKVELSKDSKKLEINAGYRGETDGDKEFKRVRGFVEGRSWLKRRRRFVKRRMIHIMRRINRRINRIYRRLFRKGSLKRVKAFIRKYRRDAEDFENMGRRAIRKEMRMLRRAGRVLRRLRRMMRRMYVARRKLLAMKRLAGKGNKRLNRYFYKTMKRIKELSKDFRIFRKAARLFRKRIRQLRRYRRQYRRNRRNRRRRRRRRFRDR